MKLEPSDEKRFLGCFSKPADASCWPWIKCVDSDGYGIFVIERQNYKAHRLSFELHKKVELGLGLCCHSCNNPSCVNPDHLYLGSPKSNVADTITVGRHGKQKLLAEDVKTIRQCLLDGCGVVALAKQFNVTPSTISNIKARRLWPNLV